MPAVEVIFFQEAEGKTAPLIEWLDGLPQKGRLKCLVRLKRLEDLGHELRRPEADYLRDGIYELRASYQGVHYRMLYFFHGRSVVVLTHGVVKEREVRKEEIDRAVRARDLFVRDPSTHRFKPER
jgi:phage-related protein